jgi:hypothetical protein
MKRFRYYIAAKKLRKQLNNEFYYCQNNDSKVAMLNHNLEEGKKSLPFFIINVDMDMAEWISQFNGN